MADLRGPEIEDFCLLKPVSRGAFGYEYLYELLFDELLCFVLLHQSTRITKQLYFVSRKVFLGYKKQAPDHIYAVKVLNKLDIVHRNMASQGKSMFMSTP